MARERRMFGKKQTNGSALRRKGHDLERYVVKTLRDIYPHATTARRESKTMDDCGVDVVNVPFLIQCKSGYESPRPKYERLFAYIEERIKDLPMYKDVLSKYPVVVVHKLNKRASEDALTVLKYKDFLHLLTLINKNDA